MNTAIFQNIKVSEEINTKEYRLVYCYGIWYTAEKIFAESDAEAIFDADNNPRIANDKLEYRLICGNKTIKTYPQSAEYQKRGWNNIVK